MKRQLCDKEGERKRWGDTSSKEDAKRSLLTTLTFNYHLDILLSPSLVHTLPDLPWEMRLGWLELPKATEQPQHLFLYAESMARKHLALEQWRVRVADWTPLSFILLYLKFIEVVRHEWKIFENCIDIILPCYQTLDYIQLFVLLFV